VDFSCAKAEQVSILNSPSQKEACKEALRKREGRKKQRAGSSKVQVMQRGQNLLPKCQGVGILHKLS